MADPVKTPIGEGVIARIVRGVRTARDISSAAWFGPEEPITPVTNEGVERESAVGRAYDYSVGVNRDTRPKANEGVKFSDLRALADGYDLMRLAIETRKDQMSRLRWRICPMDETKTPDERCARIEATLRRPDRQNSWDGWMRMIIEDMLVIDAATIYPRRTLGGELFALELVDGATIKRVIDNTGRTPMPPTAAYQQILKGLPATEYTSEELIYAPRNPRTNRIYGYSPVEQIIVTVNIALRRQAHQLQYYTEGNIPEALAAVPDSWTVHQIKEFQTYWDSLIEGETGKRRHMRFVPGDIAKGYRPTKEPPLKDLYDEWLARIVCYAFSVSPQALVSQMNRATAETAQESAILEGLEPIRVWFRDLMTMVVQKEFGSPDLCFDWLEEEEPDPETEMRINTGYVAGKIMTVDEARARIGLPPMSEEQKESLAPPALPPPERGQVAAEGTGEDSEETADEDEADNGAEVAKRKKKARNPVLMNDRDRAMIQRSVKKMRETITPVLRAWGAQAIEAITASRKEPDDVQKALPFDLAVVLNAMTFDDAAVIATDSVDVIEAVARDGVQVAALQLGLQPEEVERIVRQVNHRAVWYARQRAAELVGMRFVDGELRENPNAEWSITENTRQELRSLVEKAEKGGWSNDRLAQAIKDAHAFSSERALTIARTELAFADVAGNMMAYRASGVVHKKRWILANHGDGKVCPLCQASADQGEIPMDEMFLHGVDAPPQHPNCRCDVIPIVDEQEQNDGQG